MTLPFTQEQFLDVFAAYNNALGSIILALWLLTVAAVVMFLRSKQPRSEYVNALLAIHWTWSALAYHAAFFTRINPAAWLFSALFLLQSALLLWLGVMEKRLRFSHGRSVHHIVAWFLVAYALLYPAIVWIDGHTFPRMPTFGVPCPTAILTIGFLFAAEPPVPLAAVVIPVLWAFIAGSSALVLGVRADLMLLAAGLALGGYVAATPRSTPHRRAQIA